MKERLEEIFEEAKTLSLLGKWKEAKEKYLQILEISPDYPGVYAGLGEIELKENKPRRAEEYLRKAVSGGKPHPRLHQLLAISLIQQEKWKEAEEELEKSLAKNPSDPRPYVFLGYIAIERGEIEKAKGLLELAKNEGERSFPLSLYLMEVYFFLEEGERLKEVVKEVKANFESFKEFLPKGLRDFLKCEIALCEGNIREVRSLWEKLKKSSFDLRIYHAGLIYSPSRLQEMIAKLW
ncbi:MAG TPA: tetratricopeptide repeat protein [bacterium]|nr:tetratricopeptide repeat protein [bacterium]HEX67549.1 tetratricopeptide repeat protein [bacterium]